MIVLESLLFKKFPEVVLAISTKFDSKSSAPYFFNLSYTVGDEKQKVDENRSKFFSSLGFKNENVAYQKQIHSDTIQIAECGGNCGESDALITNRKNLALAVSVADCTPVFIYDNKNKVVAAIHSGWRGTQQKIISKTLDKLKNDFSSDPQNLFVYIGPSISQNNYEVGNEFLEYFDRKYLKQNGEKFLLDVKSANYDMLINYGIPKDNIQLSNLCTYELKNLMHSYRRDGKHSGRILGLIALK